MLRLEEAAEPAPALAQEGERAGGRVGAAKRGADDAHRPVEPGVDGVAMEPVDQLVILDHALGIEAADRDHRLAPEPGERARDQEQAVEPLQA